MQVVTGVRVPSKASISAMTSPGSTTSPMARSSWKMPSRAAWTTRSAL